MYELMLKNILKMSADKTRYLLWFAQEHLDFRFEEINSLLSMYKIGMNFVKKPDEIQPYWIVEFDSEDDIKLLTNRSVSLRSCMELWAYSDSIEGVHSIMKRFPRDLVAPHVEEDRTFKIDVETFCKHFTQKEKVEKLEAFSYLPVKGQVRLNNPDVTLQYIEYYGVDPKCPPEDPYMVFFGRWITNGLRQLIQKLSLKNRKFIGNTSMDPQLSLLMANQARVQTGDIVLDPFVGSGSLLVAAAHFGGYIFGTDIDYLMLHARTRPSRITQKKREEDESVKANMAQYNLDHKYLDVLVNDFAISFWRDDLRFDAIITDPPYGIREATEKIGTSKKNCSISDEHLPTHIPAKIEYGLAHLYRDLLTFAAKHLRIGRRLVSWFPIFREDYTEEGLPKHPCLELVANSEQVLNKHTSRRLLTYEKIKEPEEIGGDDRKNDITDFRMKYYDVREESRRERRTKKALTREQDRLEALNRRKE